MTRKLWITLVFLVLTVGAFTLGFTQAETQNEMQAAELYIQAGATMQLSCNAKGRGANIQDVRCMEAVALYERAANIYERLGEAAEQ